ncbi:MAG: hypothetical protein NTW86_12605 [Candidatus Sumerlaeota bacterium]|nr:hypothetical protein [Candidatus Sumerlaeota bacterium]
MNALLLSHDQLPAWEQAAARCPCAGFCGSRLWIEAQPPEWGALRVVGLWRGEDPAGGASAADPAGGASAADPAGGASAADLAGGATFHLRRRLGRTVWTTHPMAPYAGFWVAQSEDASPGRRESLLEEAVEALDRFLRAAATEAFLKLDPQVRDARPFLRRGWQAIPYYTYETDVAPETDLEGAFENDARRQIAKARRAGIAVRADALAGKRAAGLRRRRVARGAGDVSLWRVG